VDVAIDSSGKDSIQSCIRSLSEDGPLLVFGSTTGGINWDELRKQKYFIETGMVNQQDLKEAARYHTDQQLKPIIEDPFLSLSTVSKNRINTLLRYRENKKNSLNHFGVLSKISAISLPGYLFKERVNTKRKTSSWH
jgi:NADPH:quinone reductase-like Zn-dependent oxidoreductase